MDIASLPHAPIKMEDTTVLATPVLLETVSRAMVMLMLYAVKFEDSFISFRKLFMKIW